MVKFLSKNSLALIREQTQWALNGADIIIALGEIEKNTLNINYGINGKKVLIIPNGVSNEFFSPQANLFTEKYKIEKNYILCVGSIYPLKNQLLLAEITKDLEIPLILIGDIRDKAYFDKITSYPHILHLGVIKDKTLLASAYLSASVFTLISSHEIMPLVVLEALASNTPVMMTNNHSMSIDLNLSHVKQVNIKNITEMKESLLYLLNTFSDRTKINQKPAILSWKQVAEEHLSQYTRLLGH